MPDEVLEHIIGLYTALEEDTTFSVSNQNTPKTLPVIQIEIFAVKCVT